MFQALALCGSESRVVCVYIYIVQAVELCYWQEHGNMEDKNKLVE